METLEQSIQEVPEIDTHQNVKPPVKGPKEPKPLKSGPTAKGGWFTKWKPNQKQMYNEEQRKDAEKRKAHRTASPKAIKLESGQPEKPPEAAADATGMPTVKLYSEISWL